MTEQINEAEWRNNLKVGDEIYVSEGGLDSPAYITTVKRLTEKSIFFGDNERASKKTGRVVGSSSWNTMWVFPVTERRKIEVRTEFLLRRVSMFTTKIADNKKKFTLEELGELVPELYKWVKLLSERNKEG